MNYQKIHDSIINRARQRVLLQEQYTEKHHVIPKCEGGKEESETVILTHKEHRIVHLLRYKFNKIIGNLLAYNFMSNNEQTRKKNIKISSKLGGIYHHKKYKESSPIQYSRRQSNSGKVGGTKCRDERLGFFKLSEKEKYENRIKGLKTIVENKIGMFSDDYREKHRKKLMKKIVTPDKIFDSIGSAAKFYNVTMGAIVYRLKSKKWTEWNYLIDGEIK
jgi:hypothetical protein